MILDKDVFCINLRELCTKGAALEFRAFYLDLLLSGLLQSCRMGRE